MGVDNQTTHQPSRPIAWKHKETHELGDMLIAYLEQLGVEYIFGVSGGAIQPLYNALARSECRGGPRAIMARHEAGAAFMADGYYRQTKRLGVCCATAGPGVTNLITGVASAYANAIPMLIISSQAAFPGFGRNTSQGFSGPGIDTLSLFRHCTRYSTQVSHPEQLEQKLATALIAAFGEQPGPVHLSIPPDVLRASGPESLHFDSREFFRQQKFYDQNDIENLTNTLSASRSALFVIGEGSVNAISAILHIAECMDALVVATPHAKGLINPGHPRFRGILGRGGHHSALEALQAPGCDTIVCVGTLMSERANRAWLEHIMPWQQLIHIDNRETHFAYTPMATQVMGGVAGIFEQLLERLSPERSRRSGPIQNCPRRSFSLENEAGCNSIDAFIKPQYLMRALAERLPPETCYLVDSGGGQAWALHYLHPFCRKGRKSNALYENWFRTTLEFASRGWAIGAAIGTALGGHKGPVVCITDDANLLMSCQEITVAIQEQLPVLFVVLNCSALNAVKHDQQLTEAGSIGYEIPPMDFAGLAQGLGACGYRIELAEDLLRLDFDALFDQGGPVLLDVCINLQAVSQQPNCLMALAISGE